MDLLFLSAEEIEALITPAGAVEAIERALRTSVDPELDAPRLFSPLATGEFLLMPASSPDAVGVKVVTVAPGNPALGHPKIQALYVLFDAETLTPRVLLDGSSLTLIRTPATTAFAIRRARVSGFFASRIAFTCSRLCDGRSRSQAILVALRFAMAFARSSGTTSVGRGSSSSSIATATTSPSVAPAFASVALWTPRWSTPLYFITELRSGAPFTVPRTREP